MHTIQAICIHRTENPWKWFRLVKSG